MMKLFITLLRELGKILEEIPYMLQTELHSPNCEVKYQAESDFIQCDKLDSTLLSFTHTRAVITEQICTAQDETCKKN
jgi:hypothetical protein